MPPSVSLYGVPAALSLSTTADASAAAMLVNSGAYDGVEAQRNTMTAPSTRARPPITAMVFWPAREGGERALQGLQPADDLVAHQTDIRMISWKASRALLRTAVVSWVATEASVAVIV